MFIIPIFISHAGCGHDCVFCNQDKINGQSRNTTMTPEQVQTTIQDWLPRHRKGEAAEVAFYGGSFTGLPLVQQQSLLNAVTPFRQAGQVSHLRVSTRPDYIDPPRLLLLKEQGVTTVELGAQSMADSVLSAAGRGHKSDDTYRAAHQLQQAGFKLGLQLMVGLPADSGYQLQKTVQAVLQIKPDFVRIYPVLVLRNTPLAKQYQQGNYRPLSLTQAIAKTAWMKKRFDAHQIKVVRMGLQAGQELEAGLIAGPYHPAFGELVNSRLLFNKTRTLLANLVPHQRGCVTFSTKDHSVFRGQKSANIKRLTTLGLLKQITLQADPNQPRLTVRHTLID